MCPDLPVMVIRESCCDTHFPGTGLMRIGKPLLITTTALGLPIGIYEGFHLAGALGFLMATLIGLFGLGIAWIVRVVRAEQRAEREGCGAPK
jgi:hypothetical protein